MKYLQILIFSSLFLFVHSDLDKNNNYGPYESIYEDMALCKGPKRAECGKIEIDYNKDTANINFTLNIEKDCPLTAARVVISSKQKNNSTKKLFNYILNKPCEHFVLGPLLAETLNVTNPCKINKGTYYAHVNLRETTTMFLSPNFFYGTYTFKVIIHNKNENLLCFLSVCNIKKI